MSAAHATIRSDLRRHSSVCEKDTHGYSTTALDTIARVVRELLSCLQTQQKLIEEQLLEPLSFDGHEAPCPIQADAQSPLGLEYAS